MYIYKQVDVYIYIYMYVYVGDNIEEKLEYKWVIMS